jgi:hypothetical protein
MGDFDARLFPYVFSCRCGNEQTVTRRECVDYAGHLSRVAEAARLVVQKLHGWCPVDRVSLQCSECASDRDEKTTPQPNQVMLFDRE